VYVSKAKHHLATNQTFLGVGGWLHNVQGKYHVFSETYACSFRSQHLAHWCSYLGCRLCEQLLNSRVSSIRSRLPKRQEGCHQKRKNGSKSRPPRKAYKPYLRCGLPLYFITFDLLNFFYDRGRNLRSSLSFVKPVIVF
jgi:hypothetical protein